MKKLLLMLLIGASTITNAQYFTGSVESKTCESGWEPIERSDEYIEEFYSKLNDLNPYNLNEWLGFLQNDLAQQMVPQDSWDVVNMKTITFRNLEGPIGIAEGMFREDVIEIQIDYKYWMELDNMMKLFLIYHESGHDYWEIWHNEVHMMKPYMSMIKNDISRNMFLDWRDEMFKHIADKNQKRNGACPIEEEVEPVESENSTDDDSDPVTGPTTEPVGENDGTRSTENICHYDKR